MLRDEPGEGVFIDDIESDCAHAQKAWEASRYERASELHVSFRRWPGQGGHEDVVIDFRLDDGGESELSFGCPEEMAALGDCLRLLAERWAEKLHAIPAGEPRPKE